MSFRARKLIAVILLGGAAALVGCARSSSPAHTPPTVTPAPAPSYAVSPRGGTPATGPGLRYNACERIWCLTHGENFALDHFLTGHVGWILHEDLYGDVFVPRGRSNGPEFPDARLTVLYLCGLHGHPMLLGKGGGSIKHTGYNLTLAYSRAHFRAYGTRLDPCCLNGLGYGFLHSSAGRHYRFDDLREYRENPNVGWQKPFAARQAGG